MGQVSAKFLNGKCHICVKPLKLKLKICPSIITLLVYFRSIVVAYTGNMVQILLDLAVTNDNQTSPKKKNTKQNKQKINIWTASTQSLHLMLFSSLVELIWTFSLDKYVWLFEEFSCHPALYAFRDTMHGTSQKHTNLTLRQGRGGRLSWVMSDENVLVMLFPLLSISTLFILKWTEIYGLYNSK